MSALDLIKEAIAETDERLKITPDYLILVGIKNQLIYLLNVLEGIESNRSMLSKIILGIYAIREFEESDPYYSKLLQRCQNEAEVLRTGVRRS